MTGAVVALFFGLIAGVCAAPVWVMLALPVKVQETADGGSMALCAAAMTLGAAFAGIGFAWAAPLGAVTAWIGLLFGGIFVGMLASALTEALEVIPVMYRRLGIEGNLKAAAAALLLGKALGALIASVYG